MKTVFKDKYGVSVIIIVAILLTVVGIFPHIINAFTERVSQNNDGIIGDDWSYQPSLSSDGRFVAFLSSSTNLVPNDTNGVADIFVYDRLNTTIERVSLSGEGEEANDSSDQPVISANGRFVAFSSSASNLVENDTNEKSDVFVHDRQTGTTERVSVSSGGDEANNGSYSYSISSDGRFVAFGSSASNLVENDTNGFVEGYKDIFVHDRQTGTTERVSVSSGGDEANNQSYFASISGDGRFVVFSSSASNLVDNDTNGNADVFIHDRQTGTTGRVSVSSSGQEANSDSFAEKISGNGTYIVFASTATNLIDDDVIDGHNDVFIHNRITGETEKVSVSLEGEVPNGGSSRPSISDDGQYIVFESGSSTLVADDTNNAYDNFVYDRLLNKTEVITTNNVGTLGNGYSYEAAISPNGRYIAYTSEATNLSENDTNSASDVFVYSLFGEIQYSGSFVESVNNDGSVTGSIVVTIVEDDEFVDPITLNTHLTVTNVPAGLTPVVTRNSATQVTLTLTGNATNADNINDVNNLTITFLDGAFTHTKVANRMINYQKTNGSINFFDELSIVEDAAPNNGDANDDGVPDSEQQNVTSIINPLTNNYIVLETSCTENSLISVLDHTENETSDDAFEYPAGLLYFTLTCSEIGGTVTINQYYYEDLNPTLLVLRKYNPTTNEYFTISDSTIEESIIGGEKVIIVSFDIVDGGELDMDGEANGQIVDPSGVALNIAGVPNTGGGGLSSSNSSIMDLWIRKIKLR